MPEKINIEPINLLSELHQKMVNLPLAFRKRVCTECNWSVPTFYRKMRPATRVVKGVAQQVIPQLSNAEKEKIVEVSDEVNKAFWDYCEKFRNTNGQN